MQATLRGWAFRDTAQASGSANDPANSTHLGGCSLFVHVALPPPLVHGSDHDHGHPPFGPPLAAPSIPYGIGPHARNHGIIRGQKNKKKGGRDQYSISVTTLLVWDGERVIILISSGAAPREPRTGADAS